MNAVEIEEAVSELVAEPFDARAFPFRFIIAYGAKKATVDRLHKGDTNQSDVGGVLQRNNVHIGVAQPGEVGAMLAQLRASPKTASAKAKFILATDGEMVEAEDLVGGDVIACAFADLPRHFATFLPLAGISTVKELKNNPIDVKATGRLNKLYVELLKDNPDWATDERRHELNQFMARLIFCFFAEDTGIFRDHQFTATITQMSQAGHGSGEAQWGNTHEVLTELFRAMDTPVTHEGKQDDRHRRAAGIRPYADVFPYVNGGLFTGATDSPRFSRTARAYLLRAGELDWKEINPDIFGSMIQAVADDGERGELGMHYTSVPNILKVLNPLFLDGLREQLEAAGDSRQKLRNLRKRLSGIRVFDPACGSGNFLVIAYKHMRAIEAEIVARLGGEANLKLDERRSVIPLSNFYGIEIKGFAAEIARLALLIAEFQADCLYLSQQEARAMVLPLHKTGQIIVGNALRLDWLEVCPPVRATTGAEQDLGGTTGRLALEANGLEDGAEAETYICGNPPYVWTNDQTEDQKADLQRLFSKVESSWRSLNYVSGWFRSAANYLKYSKGGSAFVSINTICNGQHVSILWPHILHDDIEIFFAYAPFKWANLASNNAGVTVVIVGIQQRPKTKYIFQGDNVRKECKNINPYLVDFPFIIVGKNSRSVSGLPEMVRGNMPYDGGHLLLTREEAQSEGFFEGSLAGYLRRLIGSSEMIHGRERYCLWIDDDVVDEAMRHDVVARRVEAVRALRSDNTDPSVVKLAQRPHSFREHNVGTISTIVMPAVSSEKREYLPANVVDMGTIITNRNYGVFDGFNWVFSIMVSSMHRVWVDTVCGSLEKRFSYSNTLGWNTFPVPRLTEQDKADLTRAAENILLTREAHFPATIADLYDPDDMPADLKSAHEENDEVLERIYIGRRFRNDTERLEKLFELYTKMTKGKAA